MEPNDTFDTARQMPREEFIANLNLVDIVDYFDAPMDLGSHWTLNCTVTDGDRAAFTVYNMSRIPILNSTWMDSGDWFNWSYLTGHQTGRYVLKVERDTAGLVGTTVYNVNLSVNPQTDGGQLGDAGDDMNDPTGIPLESRFTGQVGDDDKADYYNFTALPGQEIKIVYGTDSGNGTGILRLLDAAGLELNTTGPVAPGTEAAIIRMSVAGGSYYLETHSGLDLMGHAINYHVNMTGSPIPPVDIIPPVVAIVSPAQGTTLDKAAVTVNGTATDNVAVHSVEVMVNHGARMVPTGLVEWTIPVVLSVGENIITAFATDTSNNTNSTEITVTVTKSGSTTDITLPTIRFTNPADGAVLRNASIQIQGVSSDDTGIMRNELSINSQPWLAVQGTTDWSFDAVLMTGRNLLTARAVDTAGNTNLSTILAYVTVDPGTDPLIPNIAITDPIDNSTRTTTQLVIKGTAGDNVAVMKVDVTVNGGSWMLATATNAQWSQWTYNAVLPEGNNSIGARATDTAGNDNTVFVTVKIKPVPVNDTDPPWVNITGPQNGTVIPGKNVMVRGYSGDNVGVAKVEVSVNGGPYELATGTSPWQYNATLLDGTNIIRARATDTSGLNNTTAINILVNASSGDIVLPTISVISPKDGTKFSSEKVEIRGISFDNVNVVKVTLVVNGKLIAVTGTVTWSGKATLKEGSNVIVATATDGAGNINTTVIKVTFEKPKGPIAGFEGLFLVAAVVVGLVILNRRRV